MEDNPLGGRKEARGLWAWRLDTLDPGSSANISFTLSGLSKGDWNDTEIFFRGNGDIIGANRIDEKLLEEMRNKEALDAAFEEAQAKEDLVVTGLSERADSIEEEESDDDKGENWGDLAPEVVE